MSALQRKLADAAVIRNAAVGYNKEAEEAAGLRGYPWPAKAWQEASEAIMNGTWKEPPPRHYPFLLTPDGPVSSALELQNLAELESLPEVMEASQVDLHDQEIGKVTICDVVHADWDRMKEKAEVTFDIGITVMFEGKRRLVLVAEALKKDVTPADDDGDENRNENGDENGDEEGSVGGKAGEEVVAGSSELGDKDRDKDGNKHRDNHTDEDGNKDGDEEGSASGKAVEPVSAASQLAESKSGPD
ncbi:hypothetical protein C8A01DRAFT_15591 [Parachaetomium inaequale]|uniref:Uncharacterized protein n=1 Tax=Parachaetomium inaequale TaxID=2588326 RepID=A0AAN6SS43_9PEZI|nr:hypothetical protein C8A01DRAFT_15591 [Parachaetomium inaequale]